MPLDERQGRHSALVKVLSANDIKHWGARFVAELTEPADAHLAAAE
jgi:trehalose-6-phosphate synthase